MQKFEPKNYSRVASIFTAPTSKLSQHRVNAMLFSMVVMTWGSLKYIQSYAESKSPDGCSKNHKRKLSMKKLRAGSIDQLILVYGQPTATTAAATTTALLLLLLPLLCCVVIVVIVELRTLSVYAFQ